jgi:ketosteroid isomerase-like protein
VSELEELKKELAALKARVAELEDHVAITQLVSQYGPSVDSGSSDATANLWTEDGVFAVVGGEQTFTMNGREDIAGMVNGAGHQGLIQRGCAHVLTVPHVDVRGDEAFGRSYALNIRWDPAADGFRVARVSANTWRWVRTAEGWKVVERVNSNLDGSAKSREMLR